LPDISNPASNENVVAIGEDAQVHHPVTTRTLRRNGELPIIVLTVRDHETDRIIGLELVADDYLTKSFGPTSWCYGQCCESTPGPRRTEALRTREPTLDMPLMRARWGDEAIKLTATEFVLSQLLDEIRRRSQSWPASARLTLIRRGSRM
jgi:DNA-binding response OmpR family regulator